MNVPPAHNGKFCFPLLLVFCLAALSGCDSWTGFERDPEKYRVAAEFRYDGENTITEPQVAEFIRIMEASNVKAQMKLNGREIKPSPTPVPVADKPAAAATATPTPSPKSSSPTATIPVKILAGWKTQVAGLLQASSDEDLEKALEQFTKLTENAR